MSRLAEALVAQQRQRLQHLTWEQATPAQGGSQQREHLPRQGQMGRAADGRNVGNHKQVSTSPTCTAQARLPDKHRILMYMRRQHPTAVFLATCGSLAPARLKRKPRPWALGPRAPAPPSKHENPYVMAEKASDSNGSLGLSCVVHALDTPVLECGSPPLSSTDSDDVDLALDGQAVESLFRKDAERGRDWPLNGPQQRQQHNQWPALPRREAALVEPPLQELPEAQQQSQCHLKQEPALVLASAAALAAQQPQQQRQQLQRQPQEQQGSQQHQQQQKQHSTQPSVCQELHLRQQEQSQQEQPRTARWFPFGNLLDSFGASFEAAAGGVGNPDQSAAATKAMAKDAAEAEDASDAGDAAEAGHVGGDAPAAAAAAARIAEAAALLAAVAGGSDAASSAVLGDNSKGGGSVPGVALLQELPSLSRQPASASTARHLQSTLPVDKEIAPQLHTTATKAHTATRSAPPCTAPCMAPSAYWRLMHCAIFASCAARRVAEGRKLHVRSMERGWAEIQRLWNANRHANPHLYELFTSPQSNVRAEDAKRSERLRSRALEEAQGADRRLQQCLNAQPLLRLLLRQQQQSNGSGSGENGLDLTRRCLRVLRPEILQGEGWEWAWLDSLAAYENKSPEAFQDEFGLQIVEMGVDKLPERFAKVFHAAVVGLLLLEASPDIDADAKHDPRVFECSSLGVVHMEACWRASGKQQQNCGYDRWRWGISPMKLYQVICFDSFIISRPDALLLIGGDGGGSADGSAGPGCCGARGGGMNLKFHQPLSRFSEEYFNHLLSLMDGPRGCDFVLAQLSCSLLTRECVNSQGEKNVQEDALQDIRVSVLAGARQLCRPSPLPPPLQQQRQEQQQEEPCIQASALMTGQVQQQQKQQQPDQESSAQLVDRKELPLQLSSSILPLPSAGHHLCPQGTEQAGSGSQLQQPQLQHQQLLRQPTPQRQPRPQLGRGASQAEEPQPQRKEPQAEVQLELQSQLPAQRQQPQQSQSNALSESDVELQPKPEQEQPPLQSQPGREPQQLQIAPQFDNPLREAQPQPQRQPHHDLEWPPELPEPRTDSGTCACHVLSEHGSTLDQQREGMHVLPPRAGARPQPAPHLRVKSPSREQQPRSQSQSQSQLHFGPKFRSLTQPEPQPPQPQPTPALGPQPPPPKLQCDAGTAKMAQDQQQQQQQQQQPQSELETERMLPPNTSQPQVKPHLGQEPATEQLQPQEPQRLPKPQPQSCSAPAPAPAPPTQPLAPPTQADADDAEAIISFARELYATLLQRKPRLVCPEEEPGKDRLRCVMSVLRLAAEHGLLDYQHGPDAAARTTQALREVALRDLRPLGSAPWLAAKQAGLAMAYADVDYLGYHCRHAGIRRLQQSFMHGTLQESRWAELAQELRPGLLQTHRASWGRLLLREPSATRQQQPLFGWLWRRSSPAPASSSSSSSSVAAAAAPGTEVGPTAARPDGVEEESGGAELHPTQRHKLAFPALLGLIVLQGVDMPLKVLSLASCLATGTMARELMLKTDLDPEQAYAAAADLFRCLAFLPPLPYLPRDDAWTRAVLPPAPPARPAGRRHHHPLRQQRMLDELEYGIRLYLVETEFAGAMAERVMPPSIALPQPPPSELLLAFLLESWEDREHAAECGLYYSSETDSDGAEVQAQEAAEEEVVGEDF